jgi:hypothetical protein
MTTTLGGWRVDRARPGDAEDAFGVVALVDRDTDVVGLGFEAAHGCEVPAAARLPVADAEPDGANDGAEDQVRHDDPDRLTDVLGVDEECDEEPEEAGEPGSGPGTLERCGADGLAADDALDPLETVPHDGRSGHVESGVGQRVDGALRSLVAGVGGDDRRVTAARSTNRRVDLRCSCRGVYPVPVRCNPRATLRPVRAPSGSGRERPAPVPRDRAGSGSAARRAGAGGAAAAPRGRREDHSSSDSPIASATTPCWSTIPASFWSVMTVRLPPIRHP